MAIYTLADLPPSRARSSSIPRQYHRIAEAERHEERFSVTDAVQLKLRIQALDHALSSTSQENGSAVDAEKFTDACQSRPFHETVYVAGSEEFYLVVKGLSRPDLIPDVYVEAYRAILQGRHYANSYKVTDFKKGVDPTFSEIRAVLHDIDRVCETDLEGAFSTLETKVKPFPFLQLPAELRLHVYSYLLPHEARLLLKPLHCEPKHPRSRMLDIMRVNKQLHDEVGKYFYDNRTLFMAVTRHAGNKGLGDEYVAHVYQAITAMNPDTLQQFRQLEIQISGSEDIHAIRKRYNPCVTNPMSHLFNKLASLEKLKISFDPKSRPIGGSFGLVLNFIGEKWETETREWLVDHIPPSLKVSWDQKSASRFFGSTNVEERLHRAIQEKAWKESDGNIPALLKRVQSTKEDGTHIEEFGRI